MKSIRIGNDIRIEWPIVLSGDVSKLQDLDLTVEVRPSAKIIDTHNYADEIRNNDNKRLLFEKHETTVMMNGGLECRRDIGDGKEHCRPRPPRPCPPRPIPPAPVKLPYHIEDNTLIAMWTADRQFATGDYDIILYAHKNEGGQAVCDQYRFVRLVSHTAQADAPDDSGIEAVIAMQPVILELSGLSAYEVAVINGFQGTEEEWLASLKKPAEDAAEELKQEIEQFKEDTKEELQADIKALGYYEDNPEFIRAYTDAEGKFLWGIRVDGSIEWAKGVPTPVQNALKELADKIKDLGGDKIEEVETALNEKIEALQDAIDVINASLKTLTDTFSFQDSPEFVNVVTDADGKVLFGLTAEGKPYFPKNTMYSVESNQEFLAAWLDSAGHVLFGLRTDGSTYVAKADFLDKIEEIRQLLEDNGIGYDELKQKVDALEDTFQHQENEEFAYVVTDNEGKILFGIKADGSPYYPNNEMYHVIQNDEYLAAWVDANNKILFGIKTDGRTYIAKSEYINAVKEIQAKIESLSETFSHQANPEFMAVTADSEGKVLEGTLLNGKKYFPMQELLDKYDDVEGRTEITLDAEGRVLAYRDKEGIRHESKLDVNKIYQNGKEVGEIASKDDIKDFATKEDLNNVTIDPSEINIAELDGVIDYSKENLFIVSEFTENFNDGTTTFAPPAENIALGYRLSNPISCKAGEWFTRNGTATALIVNTDTEDKNGERISNPQASFQAIKDGYIRVTAINNGSATLNSGKYVVAEEDRMDAVGISKMKLTVSNFTKDTKYLKAPNGKYYELVVNNEGLISTKEIDSEIIPDFDLPADMPTLNITSESNDVDFNNYGFDRVTTATGKYLLDFKSTGVTNLGILENASYNAGYSNFEHFYNSSGQERYGIILNGSEVGKNKGLIIFDNLFNVVDYLSSSYYDFHDFIYIDDGHYIMFSPLEHQDVEFNTGTVSVSGYAILEYKGELLKDKKRIGRFDLNQDSVLKDVIPDAINIFDASAHMNTITFDGNESGVDDTHIIVNLRNCDSFYRLSRNYNKENNTVAFSLLERVGGRPNSENYDIPERIKTDSLCQWFHSHDVKFWGMKNIGGQNYPTYTLFDNNWKTSYNPRNNGTNAGVENTNSRVVQLSIDWANKLVKDYKVYVIDGDYYTNAMGGATMLDEGVLFVSYVGKIGLFDFTKEKTTEETPNQKVGAEHIWEMSLSNRGQMYRANVYVKQ